MGAIKSGSPPRRWAITHHMKGINPIEDEYEYDYALAVDRAPFPLATGPDRGSIKPTETPMIEKALFGRTGHESTRAVFGGAGLAKATQEEADQVLEVLLRYGINHIDVAAAYGDAELRVAPWLRKHP